MNCIEEVDLIRLFGASWTNRRFRSIPSMTFSSLEVLPIATTYMIIFEAPSVIQ